MKRPAFPPRAALPSTGILALILFTANTALAQNLASPGNAWEFRVSSGVLVTTGDQRQQVKNARATAAQVSWVLGPRLALNGTFSWASSRDIATSANSKLDVFTSDIGAELRSAEWLSGRLVSFSGFVGLGGGARSYNYRKLDEPATNNLAGYGSVGGDIGVGRVGLRVEVREYATGFKPLIGSGKSETRNDVVLMGAVRFNRHRTPRA